MNDEHRYLVPEKGYNCFLTADEIDALMNLIDMARDGERDAVTGTPLDSAYLVLENAAPLPVPEAWRDTAESLKQEPRRLDIEFGDAAPPEDVTETGRPVPAADARHIPDA